MSSVKRVLRDFTFLFYLFIVGLLIGVYGLLANTIFMLKGAINPGWNYENASWEQKNPNWIVNAKNYVDLSFSYPTWMVILLYFIIEYITMAIIAPIRAALLWEMDAASMRERHELGCLDPRVALLVAAYRSLDLE